MRALILLLGLVIFAEAGAGVPNRFYVAKDRALAILSREDSFRAIEYVMSLDDPMDAMGVFALLARDLYWENRNLQAAMAFGRAGIQYGMAASKRANEARAMELMSEVKALAYDLSSFCWPGWNEAGVVIDDGELVLGQDLAKTNMRLARSLNKGNLPMSRAHWLIGAHHIAVEQYEAARRHFVESLRFAIAAEAREQELLIRGYLYLVDLLEATGNEKLEEEFDFILRELENSREGSFYSEQLETAYAVFVGTSFHAE